MDSENEELVKLRGLLQIALASLHDLADNLTHETEYGPYGSYYSLKWTGDDYLVDSAISTIELIEGENETEN